MWNGPVSRPANLFARVGPPGSSSKLDSLYRRGFGRGLGRLDVSMLPARNIMRGVISA
jgi:hypothetical protein